MRSLLGWTSPKSAVHAIAGCVRGPSGEAHSTVTSRFAYPRRAIRRNRSEFPTTRTLLPAIVAAATAGLITPNAANGIATAL